MPDNTWIGLVILVGMVALRWLNAQAVTVTATGTERIAVAEYGIATAKRNANLEEENARLRTDLDNLRKQQLEFQKRLLDYEADHTKLAEVEAAMKDLETRFEALTQENEQLRRENSTLRDENQQIIEGRTGLEKQLEEMRTLNLQLRAELDALKAQVNGTPAAPAPGGAL